MCDFFFWKVNYWPFMTLNDFVWLKADRLLFFCYILRGSGDFPELTMSTSCY